MAQTPKITSVLRDSKGRFSKSGMPEPILRDATGKFLPRSALQNYNAELAKTNNGKTVKQTPGFSYLNRPSKARPTDLRNKKVVSQSLKPTTSVEPMLVEKVNDAVQEVSKQGWDNSNSTRQLRQSVDNNTQVVEESNAKMGEVAVAAKAIEKNTRISGEIVNKIMEQRLAEREKKAIPLKSGAVLVPVNSATLIAEKSEEVRKGSGSVAGGVLAGVAGGSLLKRGVAGIGRFAGNAVKNVDAFFGAGAEAAMQKGFGSALLSIAPKLATTLGAGIAISLGTDFFIKGLRDAPYVRERERQKDQTIATNRSGVNAVNNAPTNPNTIFGNDPTALKQYNALKTVQEREQFLLSYGVDPQTAKKMASQGAFTPPPASVAPNVSGNATNSSPPSTSNPAQGQSPSLYTPMPGSIAPEGTQTEVGTSGPNSGGATRMPSGSLPTGQGGSISPKEAVEFFKSKGWSEEQAAGIVANLVAESGLKANAAGDGGQAYGMGQWHPDRQANFAKVFGHDIRQSTPQEQLAFVDWEMNNTEKRAGDALKQSTSRGDAAAIVSSQYERPGDKQGEMAKRSQIAQNLDLSATPAGNGNMAVGDSIAVGVGKAGNMQTAAKVGDSPQAVLDRINGLKDEDVKGKNIVLSSGYSNNPSQVGLVQKQIDALKSKGAASIKLLGVGDRPDLVSGNDKLQKIAESNNISFGGALDPNNLSADRVHPKNYSQLASSARLETPPQSSTGTAIVTSTNMRERLQDAASASSKQPIIAAPINVNPPHMDAQNKTGGMHVPPVRNDEPILLQAMRDDIRLA